MEWHDEGILLAARPHGEVDAIVSALTFEHGRHLGLVKGGAGRRSRPLLQPGNRLGLDWKARLPQHLGTFRVEAMQLLGARLIAEPLKLLALAAATGLADLSAPEREPQPRLYAGLLRLLEDLVAGEEWRERYVRYELLLLAELGFALSLDACAATGAADDLAYVSPRTGRAVSAGAGAPYAAKLLALPPFLAGAAAPGPGEFSAGLRLTGYFIRRHLLDPHEAAMPAARERLVERIMAEPQETTT